MNVVNAYDKIWTVLSREALMPDRVVMSSPTAYSWKLLGYEAAYKNDGFTLINLKTEYIVTLKVGNTDNKSTVDLTYHWGEDAQDFCRIENITNKTVQQVIDFFKYGVMPRSK